MRTAQVSSAADLFNFIEELVMWENSNNPDVIRTARAEIARCVASRLIETGALKKDSAIGPNTTVYDLAKRGHCRPIPLGLDTKVGRVRFSFDVSKLPPAEVVNAFLAEHAPPVLDPFAGGGSIPLEAQRLGLRAYASDLNPIPVLINKALIEIPPKFAGRPPVNPEARGEGPSTKGKGKKQQALVEKEWHGAAGLAEDVRYYGQWMRDEAEKRIGHLYPKVAVTAEMAQDRPDLQPYVGQQLTVIAWLWARTIQCPNPVCRARTPLVRSFWLSKNTSNQCYAKPIFNSQSKKLRFEIATKGEPPKHTTDRTGARCVICETFIKKQQLRDIAIEHGTLEIPLAIVAEGTHGRVYVDGDSLSQPDVKKPDVPFLDQPMTNDRRWFSPPLYGMPNFADLFTARQLVALTTFSDLVLEAQEMIRHDSMQPARLNHQELLDTCGIDYADAIVTYLAFGVSKLADNASALCSWHNGAAHQKIRATYGRQALPMVWDFAEGNVFSESTGNFFRQLELILRVIERLPADQSASAVQSDATDLRNWKSPPIISTDPPYYDNIGYADLSDFFYVWLRRSLSRVYPSLFSTLVTPKATELIASPHRHGGSKVRAQCFFEDGLGRAFSRMRETHHHEFPLTVYYAFKQAETEDDIESDDDLHENGLATASTGWETMLAGLIRSGFGITGTWPMRTELGNRMIGRGTNALASCIVLVCRHRADNASPATRKEFITELRRELPEALRNLQRGNIAPVDLAQAAIGPGMAVFSRYAKVIESDGSPMTVRIALGIINQVLDEVLAEQEGDFDPDTRWALAWFEQYGTSEGPYGVAETLSKAKNTAINGLVEAGVVKAGKGNVQLLGRTELPGGWNPATDKRLTVWETTQHLIRTLEIKGEAEAAALLNKLGGIGEISRELAYRLYSVCERKKWTEEALAYNGLVIAWPELSKLALSQRNRQPTIQHDLF